MKQGNSKFQTQNDSNDNIKAKLKAKVTNSIETCTSAEIREIVKNTVANLLPDK
jgi:hypothetical protein